MAVAVGFETISEITGRARFGLNTGKEGTWINIASHVCPQKCGQNVGKPRLSVLNGSGILVLAVGAMPAGGHRRSPHRRLKQLDCWYG